MKKLLLGLIGFASIVYVSIACTFAIKSWIELNQIPPYWTIPGVAAMITLILIFIWNLGELLSLLIFHE